jgi:hypothetical protein
MGAQWDWAGGRAWVPRIADLAPFRGATTLPLFFFRVCSCSSLWARIGSRFLVYSALVRVFLPFFHCIRLASSCMQLAFVIPTNLSIPPAPIQDPMKFCTYPKHTFLINERTITHKHDRPVHCVHHLMCYFLSLLFCPNVVQIESTSHSPHTNQQLWQTLAVFICTVHDVYNLQLTYIN